MKTRQNDDLLPGQTRLLILRIWQPPSSQPEQGYIRLQDTHSGEVVYFKDWAGLFDYLQTLDILPPHLSRKENHP